MANEYASRTNSPWGKVYNPQINDQTGRRQLHETGAGFSLPTREAARINLQGAMSTANPEDYADLDSLRGAFRGQLERQGHLSGVAGSQLDTRMQRGLGNMLSQYKRQSAGSGRIGTPQYDRGMGDIVGKLSEEYGRGINDLETSNLGRLGQIQSGFRGIYDQDASKRDRQFGQAQSLSDLLMRQIGADDTREAGLRELEQKQKKEERDFWSGLFSTAVSGGTKMATAGAGGAKPGGV